MEDRSKMGNGQGIPTAAQPVTMARYLEDVKLTESCKREMKTYQPHTAPIMPNPPANLNKCRMCSWSASVVAVATAKSAAAMNANSMTRPKKVSVKRALTRKVQIRKTKLTMVLESC